MKTKTREQYGAVIIELKGNVMGGDDTKEFNDLLHKLLDEDKKNIVVDLAEVKFMNSSGLGMLIGGLTTEKIESLLVITKLITIFESYDSVEEAVKSFSN